MKEFLQYLFGRLKDVKPVTHKVGEQEYAVTAEGTLGAPVRALAPQWDKPTFHVGTLSALKEIYEARVDDFGTEVGLHVADYLTVHLIALKADDFGRRHIFATAKYANETPFEFGKYLAVEKFLIDLRASFFFNDETVKVQQLCSRLESGSTVSVANDGMSQKIEIKIGVESKSETVIPADGVELIPWRTFRDVSPVTSKFLLQLKPIKDSLPLVALFEIDQKWKLDTIHSIGDWLRKHIKDAKVIA